jgi:hypothetical protein
MNLRVMSFVIVFFVGCFCASALGEEQGCASLESHIGKASRDVYKDITDAQNWKNPFLIVGAEGVTLINSKRLEQFLPVEDVSSALSRMPVSAWPYGLVVALQENGVRARDDSEKIAKNVTRLRAMLATCRIRVESWPSA